MTKKQFIAALASALVFITSPTVFALTANTTVSSAISQSITLFTTDGTVNLDVTPTGSGAQTIATDTVTISTNDSSGYTLSMSASGSDTNLISGSDTLPASAGTQTSPVAQLVDTWGYAVQSLGGFNTSGYASANSQAISGSLKFAGVPASGSPNTIATRNSAISNDQTTVYYAAAADTAQPSGTYTQTVTYTALGN